MSLLGLDVGTSGCKAVLFSQDGRVIASAYEEYDTRSPQPGWAELDAAAIWQIVKGVIRRAAAGALSDPLRALAVASMGEALVPVSRDRQVLGPSLLNFDARGAEYLQTLAAQIEPERLYDINGNSLGNQYSLTKLLWIREHQPQLYASSYKFLPWSAFIAYMLGAEAVLDYTLANRTLLFDLEHGTWSGELLERIGLSDEKLPDLAPSGTAIGTVADSLADELGLPHGVVIVSGAHDQAANAVGSGVIEPGQAFYGMGSYHCITPVVAERRPAQPMLVRGLSTEHHAVPGRYLTFIYNHGGTVVKWFRDTFAGSEQREARRRGEPLYPQLLQEMPDGLSSILALPTFAPTGTPDFRTDTCGLLVGLHLDTGRGDILRGILEGVAFYLKQTVDALPGVGIAIDAYRVVGGGSRSDSWVQLSADLFGRPFARPAVTEAGALGSAILAGVGSGLYPDCATGVQAMVRLERTFEPDLARHRLYQERGEQYRTLAGLTDDYLAGLHRSLHSAGADQGN